MIRSLLYLGCLYLFIIAACSTKQDPVTLIKHYPVDSLEGVIDYSGVRLDNEFTSDGNGSLRIETGKPVTLKLFQTGDIDIENAKLVYKAHLRVQDLVGKVYLEMLCRFPGKGEFFSRALHSSLSGNQDWTIQDTPFFLKKGENPNNIQINLVVDGKGTAWIDDIRLEKTPLK